MHFTLFVFFFILLFQVCLPVCLCQFFTLPYFSTPFDLLERFICLHYFLCLFYLCVWMFVWGWIYFLSSFVCLCFLPRAFFFLVFCLLYLFPCSYNFRLWFSFTSVFAFLFTVFPHFSIFSLLFTPYFVILICHVFSLSVCMSLELLIFHFVCIVFIALFYPTLIFLFFSTSFILCLSVSIHYSPFLFASLF